MGPELRTRPARRCSYVHCNPVNNLVFQSARCNFMKLNYARENESNKRTECGERVDSFVIERCNVQYSLRLGIRSMNSSGIILYRSRITARLLMGAMHSYFLSDVTVVGTTVK